MTTKDDIITALDGLDAEQLNKVAILVLELGKAPEPFDGTVKNPIPIKPDVETMSFDRLIKWAIKLHVPHDEIHWDSSMGPDNEDELRVAVAEAMEKAK